MILWPMIGAKTEGNASLRSVLAAGGALLGRAAAQPDCPCVFPIPEPEAISLGKAGGNETEVAA